MIKSATRLFAFTAASFLLAAAAPAFADSYSIKTIDVPGQTGTVVNGINDLGQLVGTYNDSSGVGVHGFEYSNGVFTTLSNGFYPGGINNSGQIIATNRIYSSAGGSYTAIPLPSPFYVALQANGINNLGQVTGVLYSDPNNITGFLYSGGTVSTIVGSATPKSINDHGEVIGIGPFIDPFHTPIQSFIDVSGNVTWFSAPGAFDTYANGVNNSGEIVGSFNSSSFFGPPQGFVDQSGAISTFDVPGAISTALLGVNNEGQIIGTYQTSDFVAHAFVATPTPEPATALLLGIGLAGAALLRRRKLV